MKKYFALLIVILGLFLLEAKSKNRDEYKVEEKKSFGIYYLSVIAETEEINVEAHEREENSGKWLRTRFLKISKDGEIREAIELNDNDIGTFGMVGFDKENNLWLYKWNGKIYYRRNFLYKISSQDIKERKIKPLLISTDFDFEGDHEYVSGILREDYIYLFPNMISRDKGKTWEDIGDMMEYVTEGEEYINYAFEYSTFTLYKCIFKMNDDKSMTFKIEKFDFKANLWKKDEEIIINKKNIKIGIDFFVVSGNYYVFAYDAWDAKKARGSKNFLIYDRKGKKLNYYENVFSECSDYEIIGPEPQVIVGDKLFCQCLRGGYVVLNLKSGEWRKKDFDGRYCEFYQSPFSNFVMLISGAKLFISGPEEETWKEILDVSKVNLSKADVVLDKKEVKR